MRRVILPVLSIISVFALDSVPPAEPFWGAKGYDAQWTPWMVARASTSCGLPREVSDVLPSETSLRKDLVFRNVKRYPMGRNFGTFAGGAVRKWLQSTDGPSLQSSTESYLLGPTLIGAIIVLALAGLTIALGVTLWVAACLNCFRLGCSRCVGCKCCFKARPRQFWTRTSPWLRACSYVVFACTAIVIPFVVFAIAMSFADNLKTFARNADCHFSKAPLSLTTGVNYGQASLLHQSGIGEFATQVPWQGSVQTLMQLDKLKTRIQGTSTGTWAAGVNEATTAAVGDLNAHLTTISSACTQILFTKMDSTGTLKTPVKMACYLCMAANKGPLFDLLTGASDVTPAENQLALLETGIQSTVSDTATYRNDVAARVTSVGDELRRLTETAATQMYSIRETLSDYFFTPIGYGWLKAVLLLPSIVGLVVVVLGAVMLPIVWLRERTDDTAGRFDRRVSKLVLSHSVGSFLLAGLLILIGGMIVTVSTFTTQPCQEVDGLVVHGNFAERAPRIVKDLEGQLGNLLAADVTPTNFSAAAMLDSFVWKYGSGDLAQAVDFEKFRQNAAEAAKMVDDAVTTGLDQAKPLVPFADINSVAVNVRALAPVILPDFSAASGIPDTLTLPEAILCGVNRDAFQLDGVAKDAMAAAIPTAIQTTYGPVEQIFGLKDAQDAVNAVRRLYGMASMPNDICFDAYDLCTVVTSPSARVTADPASLDALAAFYTEVGSKAPTELNEPARTKFAIELIQSRLAVLAAPQQFQWTSGSESSSGNWTTWNAWLQETTQPFLSLEALWNNSTSAILSSANITKEVDEVVDAVRFSPRSVVGEVLIAAAPVCYGVIGGIANLGLCWLLAASSLLVAGVLSFAVWHYYQDIRQLGVIAPETNTTYSSHDVVTVTDSTLKP